MLNERPAPDLDAVFSVLAHSTRRTILEQPAHGDRTVPELAAPHDVRLPAIRRHLRVLEAAGLVAQKKDGRLRICNLEAPIEAIVRDGSGMEVPLVVRGAAPSTPPASLRRVWAIPPCSGLAASGAMGTPVVGCANRTAGVVEAAFSWVVAPPRRRRAQRAAKVKKRLHDAWGCP